MLMRVRLLERTDKVSLEQVKRGRTREDDNVMLRTAHVGANVCLMDRAQPDDYLAAAGAGAGLGKA